MQKYDITSYQPELLPKEALKDDLKFLISEMETLGIRSNGSRLQRYLSTLETFPKSTTEYADLLNDSDTKRFKSTIDYQTYLTREIHVLMFILKGIKTNLITGYEEKFEDIIKGANFAHLDKNPKSRNTQFELWIASYFALSGYKVDLSTETDLVAKKGWTTFYIECKRIISRKTLNKRFKKAEEQIKNRIPKQGLLKRYYGLIFIDVSQYIVPGNGIAIGTTMDAIQDEIRNRVAREIEYLDRSPLDQTILLSLHCFASVCSLLPPFIATFSTHNQLWKKHASFRELLSIGRVYAALRSLNLSDERAYNTRKPSFPTKIAIPAGTQFSCDEELLSDYVTTGKIPDIDINSIVYELIYPEGDIEKFSFHEFRIAVANLTNFTGGDRPQTVDEYRVSILKALLTSRTIMKEQASAIYDD